MTPDGKDPNSKLVDVDWESNGDSFAAAESCLATALSISCCSCYFWEKGSPTKRIVLTPPPCPHMYRTLRRTFLSIKKVQKYRGKGFDPLEIRAHRAFLQAFNGQCPNSQHIYPMGLSKSTQLSRPLCLWQHLFLAHPFSLKLLREDLLTSVSTFFLISVRP